MTKRLVRILDVPPEGSVERSRSTVIAARALRVPLGSAAALFATSEVPIALPLPLEPAEAESLARELHAAGAQADVMDAPESNLRCAEHHRLLPSSVCPACDGRMCGVCVALSSGGRCPACEHRRHRGAGIRRARLALLVSVLLGTIGWAVGREVKAEHRRDWKDPVSVAVIVLEYEPVSDATYGALRGALHDLEAVLQAEYARYTSDGMRPFQFVLTEERVSAYPPFPHPGAGVLESIEESWSLWRYLRSVDHVAADTVAGADIRVYVLTQRRRGDEPAFVEGVGTRNGSFGLVRAILTQGMAAQAAVAIAHEAFHCLGASDKYGPMGHALLPGGLVDPEAVPLLPQTRGEVMVGEVPLGEQTGRLIEDVSEVGVGPTTAREVGWARR